MSCELERRAGTSSTTRSSVDGVFGSDDLEAVYAFQKVERLARTGSGRRRGSGRAPALRTSRVARYGGDHIEVDKTRQVLFVVRGGKVALAVAASTGATGNTPLGLWHVYRKVTGFDWVLYYPSYFLRGFAVHGYPDVPPYPASHGCVRIPMWIATQPSTRRSATASPYTCTPTVYVYLEPSSSLVAGLVGFVVAAPAVRPRPRPRRSPPRRPCRGSA